MKFFRNLGKYPFMMLLIISAVILTLAAYMGKNSVYADYSVDLLKHPRLSVVFEGIKDKNYPWGMAKDNKPEEVAKGDGVSNGGDSPTKTPDKNTSGDGSKGTDSNTPGNGSPDTGNGTPANGSGNTGKSETDNGAEGTGKDSGSQNTGKNETGNGTQNNGSQDTGKNDTGNGSQGTGKSETDNGPQDTGKNGPGKGDQTGTKDGSKDNDSNSSGNGSSGTGKTKGDNDPGNAADPDSPSSYEYVAVKKSYFDDALFIGDSRTVGLADYSGWKNPTFFADVGLTIYDVFDKKIAEIGGKKMTIEEALQKKSFQKIYIMLGINEMGTGTAKSFTKAYKEVVERIEELQPDAIIFVEAIMNVTKEKSDTDPIFNNKNIKDRNNHLEGLADDKKIFYIDVNEAITDKTGGIPAKYTFDNIHLKAAYYKIWTDFLLKHGVAVK